MAGRDDRDRVLRCPFCKRTAAPPEEIDTPFGGSVDGGRCACGAVYVYDRTGRMLGEAFSEALAMAYDWDYEAAFSAPEEERGEAVISYNSRARQFMLDQDTRFTKAPRFCFIKRKHQA